MIKLYLKTVVIAIILLSLSIVVYFSGYNYIMNTGTQKIDLILDQGGFAEIQRALAKTPKVQWQEELDKLSLLAGRKISITKIADIDLISSQREAIYRNEIIFKGSDWIFLNYVALDTDVYQRIPETDLAVTMKHGVRANDTISSASQFMVRLISARLFGATPRNQKLVLTKLEKQYGFPIHLYSKDSAALPEKIKTQLQTNNLAFQAPENGYIINELFYNFPARSEVLALGPISYTPVAHRITDIQNNYFYTFVILALFFVFALTWLFSRNVRKIFTLTQEYGRGNFSKQMLLGRTSVLQGVYENIIGMGASLHALIESQRNMSRFVAHEIRTPLYSMQLATDSLGEIEGLPVEARKYIAGFKEDIDDLNELVAQFLLYSQSSSHELRIIKSVSDIKSWLSGVVSRRQSNDIAVIFECDEQDNIDVSFDSKILKHVIDNVLLNALKFAEHSVVVTLLRDKTGVRINIEDDGPGIAPEDSEKIFEPFATLDASDTGTKHVGLGLAIAKSIVLLHHGALFVQESDLGGCLFVIKLPD